MTQLNLGGLRRGSLPPVATAAAAVIGVLGLLDALLPGGVAALLGVELGAGPAGALQLWRPVTFGVVPNGLLSAVLAVVFTYWVLSSTERLWGPVPVVLVGLAGTMTAAAMAVWFFPYRGVLGGAGLLAWGVICGFTYHQWRRGANVRDQLMILLLCGLMNLTGGVPNLMLSLAAAAGGVAAAHLLFEVRLPQRKPEDPYEAFVRARQGRAARKAPSATWLVAAYCGLMLLLWAVRLLMG